MKNLEIKILENGSGLPLPKYETHGAAGLDLLAAIKENKKPEKIFLKSLLIQSNHK